MSRLNNKIYCLKNITNGKVYIGSAANFSHRKNQHLHLLRSNQHHCNHLQNAYNKYGEQNFVFEILEHVEDKNLLLEREQWWIDNYDGTIYNSYKDARSPLGRVVSPETKVKISNTLTGYKHSDETKIKLRQRPVLKDHLDALHLSNRKSIYQIDRNTNETINKWDSIREAALSMGISEKTLGNAVAGRLKTAGGYKWQKVNN